MPRHEDVWTVGMKGVQLVHVTTRKILTVSDNKYPDWGENMTEVVTTEDNRILVNKWTVDFIRYPKYSKY